MPYYKFVKAIDYKGGEYGTAILSRYPIESFTVTPLSSGDDEGRSIGKAVINVKGTTLDFYCTHLSYKSAELRKNTVCRGGRTYFNIGNLHSRGGLQHGGFQRICSLGRHLYIPTTMP